MSSAWSNWLVGTLAMMIGVAMMLLLISLPILFLPGFALTACGAQRLFRAWRYG